MSSIQVILQRKTPRQERAKATVEAILEGSSQVLVSRGYAKMTTTRVARRAGVSIGTLYQYFDDKEALVRALWERHQLMIFGAIGEAMTRTEDSSLAVRIEQVLGAVLSAKASDASLTTVLSTTMTQLDGPAHLVNIHANNQAVVRAVFEAHADEIDVEDIDQTIFVVVSAIEGVINAAIATRSNELGDASLLEGLTRMILSYVATEEQA